ncbi:unnamed protein product [Leptosia nina]|uniref:Uncharacterized protein n=1 Tax=Leptosia nina TaxID=320188 RepID=A0AAV1JC70_9NEOP
MWFLLFATLSTATAQVQLINGTIKLEIGLTSRCNDAHNFIHTFSPIYEKYRQFLEVDFVPWGRTRRLANGLDCQFGVQDCWANRVHRCVLSRLNDQDSVMKYMVCEFTRPLPAFSGSYSCVQKMGLRIVDVDYCVSTTGDALDREMEARAAEAMRVINFVPYLVINGVMERALSETARLGIVEVICSALAKDPSTGVMLEECLK